ncbi:hypothetical protein D9Q98_008103 [Chlorella vulgaris]|uniref:Uncharacterized protein n=1 Tax=Chlorella vulgaris TaxID=3077 RepID=A0A9D4TG04_CHLVU|nr:hypothetical protein D9Q98_008103 [Chlorella vulgaris]
MARGYPGQKNPFGPIYMIGGLLTAGCSIAILVIVNAYLWYTSYYYGGGFAVYSNACYMQTPDSQDSVNICYYSWAAAGLGIFFSLWLVFMQLCSGRHRHIPVCEVMVCVLALLWWIGCSITAMIYGQNADDYGNSSVSGYAQVLKDKEGWRTSVWALGWAQVGLWAICAAATLKDCASNRGKPPPEAAMGAYPPGAYAQPVYQEPPPYYAAPPPQQYNDAPPQYPPAGAPTGYPPAPAGYP